MITADICRCHDDQCLQHLTCQRWVHRLETEPPAVNHVDTLFPDCRPRSDPCPSYIPPPIVNPGQLP